MPDFLFILIIAALLGIAWLLRRHDTHPHLADVVPAYSWKELRAETGKGFRDLKLVILPFVLTFVISGAGYIARLLLFSMRHHSLRWLWANRLDFLSTDSFSEIFSTISAANIQQHIFHAKDLYFCGPVTMVSGSFLFTWCLWLAALFSPFWYRRMGKNITGDARDGLKVLYHAMLFYIAGFVLFLLTGLVLSGSRLPGLVLLFLPSGALIFFGEITAFIFLWGLLASFLMQKKDGHEFRMKNVLQSLLPRFRSFRRMAFITVLPLVFVYFSLFGQQVLSMSSFHALSNTLFWDGFSLVAVYLNLLSMLLFAGIPFFFFTNRSENVIRSFFSIIVKNYRPFLQMTLFLMAVLFCTVLIRGVLLQHFQGHDGLTIAVRLVFYPVFSAVSFFCSVMLYRYFRSAADGDRSVSGDHHAS